MRHHGLLAMMGVYYEFTRKNFPHIIGSSMLYILIELTPRRRRYV